MLPASLERTTKNDDKVTRAQMCGTAIAMNSQVLRPVKPKECIKHQQRTDDAPAMCSQATERGALMIE